ncbi:hypothetical protein BD560DRAFT_425576 [Blakeslea trispora]|nr:hypothetical protein BD560DRAFT_425576 [Blakeslea trispora]
MGLLNFRKQSKKQQVPDRTFTQSNIDISSPLPVYRGQDYIPLSTTTLANHQELSRANDTSLMDDIMNVLDASNAQTDLREKSIVLSAQDMAGSIPNSSELENAKSSKVQQKPPPHFSSHDSKKSTLQPSQQTVHQESKKIQQQRHSLNASNNNSHEDNAILSSNLPTAHSLHRYSAPVTIKRNSNASSPPIASDPNHAITLSTPYISKSIMDRLKERHRQETRKASSPFGNRTTSSPSMPIINGTTVDLSNKNRTQKRMSQSQSFTTYVRLTNKNESNSGESPSATNSIERQSSPLQPKPETNPLHLHYLPQSTRVMYQQQLLPQENTEFEPAPTALSYPVNRSVSAYPGLATQSIQQQQQILLQQQQIQQQQLHQQQFQQQRLEEQQNIHQQKIHQIQIEQKKQHEQDNINRAILDSLVTSKLDAHQNSETAKHHFSLKPLYKRAAESNNKNKRGHHHYHHHHHHHRRQCNSHSENHVHQSIVFTKNSSMCTPPPKSKQAIVSEAKEPSETPLSPISLKDEERHISDVMDTMIANSSSSTLSVESKPNEDKRLGAVRLPRKLKRELQDMHLRRSLYSLPDLSKLSQEQVFETEDSGLMWNSVSLFPSVLDKVELSAQKLKGRRRCCLNEGAVNCEARKKCCKKSRPVLPTPSKCCHHHRQCNYHCHSRHCCPAIACTNCSRDHASEVSAADCVGSTRKNSVEIEYRAPICRSKKHCKHN